MKKLLLSFMGIITILALSIGVTNPTKLDHSNTKIQSLSVGDGGG
ncbi:MULTISPECIES: Phr family secreted Rap phosphatase inhibitor [Bacillus cereus group]|nr:Phr family secreted Rap phosphatase inhibitor [Bacillus mycoides]